MMEERNSGTRINLCARSVASTAFPEFYFIRFGELGQHLFAISKEKPKPGGTMGRMHDADPNRGLEIGTKTRKGNSACIRL